MTAALAPGEVTCIDGFLSADQCAELLDDLSYAWWWPSPIIRMNPDGTLLSHTSFRRTSTTTSEEWLSERSVDLLRHLEGRLADRLGLDPSHLEMWQATRYRRGDAFDEHHDAGFFADDPRGERTTTVLVYLEAHKEGGNTLFPRLGRRFHPAPGRVLVWPNLLPDGSVDERMRHEARPARTIKTVLTTWERQRATRNGPQLKGASWLA